MVATVLTQRTIEPFVYLIGMEAIETSLVGLFDLDLEFCKDRFAYEVTCTTCTPDTIINYEDSSGFRIFSTNFDNEGIHNLTITG